MRKDRKHRADQITILLDHTKLEILFDEMLAAARADDWRALSPVWSRFESGLTDHMKAEEDHILPEFGQTHPAQAERILAEHRAARELLLDLGVGIELHQFRLAAAEKLIADLRAHKDYEDQVLYPWAAARVGALPDPVSELVLRESGPHRRHKLGLRRRATATGRSADSGRGVS